MFSICGKMFLVITFFLGFIEAAGPHCAFIHGSGYSTSEVEKLDSAVKTFIKANGAVFVKGPTYSGPDQINGLPLQSIGFLQNLQKLPMNNGAGRPGGWNIVAGDARIVKCNTIGFTVLDTSKSGYAEHAKAACLAASMTTKENAAEIANTVIVSHSMGNLIMASALEQGKCSFAASGVTWLSLAAPWLGTPASDLLCFACPKVTMMENMPAMKMGAGLLKTMCLKTSDSFKCSEGQEKLKAMDESGKRVNLVQVGRAKVTKGLCGTENKGKIGGIPNIDLFGIAKQMAKTIGKQQLANVLDANNDMMVDEPSCKGLGEGKTDSKQITHRDLMGNKDNGARKWIADNMPTLQIAVGQSAMRSSNNVNVAFFGISASMLVAFVGLKRLYDFRKERKYIDLYEELNLEGEI